MASICSGPHANPSSALLRSTKPTLTKYGAASLIEGAQYVYAGPAFLLHI